MKFWAILFIIIPVSLVVKGQQLADIIFQATSPNLTVRQYSFETSKQENFIAYYSTKHHELLLSKTDFERFPDTDYKLVKARFTVFKSKKYADSPEQSFIRIDYYYLEPEKANPSVIKEVAIDCYTCTRQPRTSAVKDIIQQDKGSIVFVIDETKKWIMENTGKADDSIFYTESNGFTSYALMITNLKRLVTDGKRL